MKKILISIIIISSLIACNSTQQNVEALEKTSENVATLNGNWKFNTIYGMGSNPLNIIEQKSDIVIDNNDKSRIEIKGKWKTKKVGGRGSVFYGEDYLTHSFGINEADNNYVRYKPTIIKTGYYEALVKYPFASHLTAQVNINHSEGKTSEYVSQRTDCGQWISLGIFKFNASENNYVEVTAITEGVVAADAVMFRPISEEKYTEAKEQPNQVYLSEYNDSDWHNLKVPGHWGMLNSYSNYNGLGWYRKEFKLPEGWKANSNEKIRLKFDGVYHVAKVYLNGQFIGKHRGGFTPFDFEVEDQLNFNGRNIIAVEVDNRNKVGATWNWGGIIRDVTLVKNNEVRINNQYIHATPDLEKGTAALRLKVKVENNSDKAKSISVKSIISKEGKISELAKTVEVPANVISEVVLEEKLEAKNVELWHFDNPELYNLETTISENGTVIDSKNNDFGIRKVEVTDSKLLLNGEPVRLGGFNRVSEHRYYGSSEPMEVLEKDVDLMKEAGANFMRIMHGTQNKKLIELCDKKGILIFEEVNVRDLGNPEFTAPDYPLAKHWLKGMVERDWNHPSIIGWSVGNELSNHYEYAKTTIDFVRELDPNRLVTCVSNSGQKSFSNRKTDPNTEVDIIMHNMYRWQGEPQVIIDKLRSEWPEKPIFISEYGFDPYPTTSLDGDQQIFSDWNEHWRGKNEFVIGGSLWTFNDYRSGYAATSQEENRVWGLINVWRQKRRMFNRVAKEFSPIKDIEVRDLNLSKNKAEVFIPIRGLNDYPSYALNNYKLEWNFRNTDGKVVEEKSIELPAINPEDKTWKGEITWGKLPKDLLDLRIRLVSSTGYLRYEKVIPFTVAKSPQISSVDLGDASARVFFEKVPGATEYLLRYKNDKGETVESFKTITNAIELDSLTNNKEYSFSVIALNDKGESTSPNTVKAKPNGKLLAPKIWDAFITDNKIVIGYTSEFEDTFYNVKYGASKENLDKEFRSNVRGMMTIDIENEDAIYFQIQREIGDKKGNWTQIVKAEKQ
ncbi:glycoside hydrolase family 2 TIM barrel-domain containing protein [Lutibacter sp. TH_r2]|uniref:glycoside hydrolase family 2 TIM barrel-domain containing protein n=1 Tax=Lutibacter sp. TH_r2 TaxID=3082083 RepID=UPI0029537EE2|nr:glycoside hydrolase family 2 TIM barrel-domain containing protein [Lutibacter sp. TH_r2]MDV7185897.1 glycoside hydrolase family 2 TIM barrel-domain containing protein [Lutibacter sp. TH_r2]